MTRLILITLTLLLTACQPSPAPAPTPTSAPAPIPATRPASRPTLSREEIHQLLDDMLVDVAALKPGEVRDIQAADLAGLLAAYGRVDESLQLTRSVSTPVVRAILFYTLHWQLRASHPAQSARMSEEFDAALKGIAPMMRDIVAWSAVAVALEAGELAEAEQAITRVDPSNPRGMWVAVYVASVLRNDAASAARALEAVSRPIKPRDPNDLTPLLDLGGLMFGSDTFAKLMAAGHDAAVADLLATVAADDRPSAYAEIAHAYVTNSRLDDAAASLAKAAGARSESSVRLRLAVALAKAGRAADARREFDAVHAVAKALVDPAVRTDEFATLAQNYARAGMLDKARAVIVEMNAAINAIPVDETSPYAQRYAAESAVSAHVAVGDFQAAEDSVNSLAEADRSRVRVELVFALAAAGHLDRARAIARTMSGRDGESALGRIAGIQIRSNPGDALADVEQLPIGSVRATFEWSSVRHIAHADLPRAQRLAAAANSTESRLARRLAILHAVTRPLP